MEGYFNAFCEVKRLKQFSAGVQSAYFAILARFYEQHFPANIALSTLDLKALAGLKSVSSTHEAKNVLKNNGLVNFQKSHDTTIYSLSVPNMFKTATFRKATEPRVC